MRGANVAMTGNCRIVGYHCVYISIVLLLAGVRIPIAAAHNVKSHYLSVGFRCQSPLSSIGFPSFSNRMVFELLSLSLSPLTS